MLSILRKELACYYYSPLAWVVMSLFLVVQGYSFFLIIKLINHPQGPHGAAMKLFFGGTILFWLSVIFVASVITMRLVAEERRLGTIESLMTAPVTETQVVLGKYLAALLFHATLWIPSLLYVAVLWQLSGRLDLGPVASGYLGTMLVGASFLAVGTLGSVLVKHQIIAAVLTFTMLVGMLMVGPLELFVTDPTLKAVIDHISLFDQMEDFGRGIVDSRHLVYHGSVICFCLCCCVKVLEGSKWR